MPGGRPTKMTESVLRKLEDAFLMGCTDEEACLLAEIGTRTLYDYQEANPEFSQRKAVLKTNPTLQAKRIQLRDLEEGNSGIAQKVIDRNEGTKHVLTGPNDGPIAISFQGVSPDAPSD